MTESQVGRGGEGIWERALDKANRLTTSSAFHHLWGGWQGGGATKQKREVIYPGEIEGVPDPGILLLGQSLKTETLQKCPATLTQGKTHAVWKPVFPRSFPWA